MATFQNCPGPLVKYSPGSKISLTGSADSSPDYSAVQAVPGGPGNDVSGNWSGQSWDATSQTWSADFTVPPCPGDTVLLKVGDGEGSATCQITIDC